MAAVNRCVTWLGLTGAPRESVNTGTVIDWRGQTVSATAHLGLLTGKPIMVSWGSEDRTIPRTITSRWPFTYPRPRPWRSPQPGTTRMRRHRMPCCLGCTLSSPTTLRSSTARKVGVKPSSPPQWRQRASRPACGQAGDLFPEGSAAGKDPTLPLATPRPRRRQDPTRARLLLLHDRTCGGTDPHRPTTAPDPAPRAQARSGIADLPGNQRPQARLRTAGPLRDPDHRRHLHDFVRRSRRRSRRGCRRHGAPHLLNRAGQRHFQGADQTGRANHVQTRGHSGHKSRTFWPSIKSLNCKSASGPGRTRTDDTRGVNASSSCWVVLLGVAQSYSCRSAVFPVLRSPLSDGQLPAVRAHLVHTTRSTSQDHISLIFDYGLWPSQIILNLLPPSLPVAGPRVQSSPRLITLLLFARIRPEDDFHGQVDVGTG
jgi:hypothetical protein